MTQRFEPPSYRFPGQRRGAGQLSAQTLPSAYHRLPNTLSGRRRVAPRPHPSSFQRSGSVKTAPKVPVGHQKQTPTSVLRHIPVKAANPGAVVPLAAKLDTTKPAGQLVPLTHGSPLSSSKHASAPVLAAFDHAAKSTGSASSQVIKHGVGPELIDTKPAAPQIHRDTLLARPSSVSLHVGSAPSPKVAGMLGAPLSQPGPVLHTPSLFDKPVHESKVLEPVAKAPVSIAKAHIPIDKTSVTLAKGPAPIATHHGLLAGGHAKGLMSSHVHPAMSAAQTAPVDPKLPIAHAPVSQPALIPAAAPQQVHNVPAAVPHHVPAAVPHHVPAAVPHQIPAAVPQQLPAAVLQQIPAAVPHQVPAAVPHHVQAAVPHQVPAAVPHHLQAAVAHQAPAATHPVVPGPDQVLHDELVNALVAILQGQVAAAPGNTPTQAHAHVASPYLSPAQQFGFGSNMYMQHPMMPAHLYPAYMQEMMFGDTQDPPDPTQPTPNVTTTTAPDTTAAAVTTEIPVAHTEPTVTEASTADMFPADTTTETPPTDLVTFEPISTTMVPDTTTTEATHESFTAATTEIPLPNEHKAPHKPQKDPVLKPQKHQILAIAKAVKSLRGKMNDATRQKLLTGIKNIVATSKVDLSSLKATLAKQLAALQDKPKKAREYTDPAHITDTPPPMDKTTLPPPSHVTVQVTNHVTQSTNQHAPKPSNHKSTNEITPVKGSVKIQSLVDSGSESGTGTLQTILEKLAQNSNGKRLLPQDLGNVNVADIARKLAPEGSDLVTQLRDPNFLQLLKQVVSKLHAIVHAHAPTVTSASGSIH